jgi:hypothetical protein
MVSHLRIATAVLVLSLACSCRTMAQEASAGKAAAAGVAANSEGSRLWESVVDGQSVVISGRIRMVGSDPFAQFVLTDSQEHDWAVEKDARKLLAKLQTQTVKVQAIVRIKKQILANGKRLPDMKELTQVKLLD